MVWPFVYREFFASIQLIFYSIVQRGDFINCPKTVYPLTVGRGPLAVNREG